MAGDGVYKNRLCTLITPDGTILEKSMKLDEIIGFILSEKSKVAGIRGDSSQILVIFKSTKTALYIEAFGLRDSDRVVGLLRDSFMSPERFGVVLPFKKKNPSKKTKAVSAKIRLLMDEGYKQKQAIAIALKLWREGRLGPRGGLKK